MSAAVAERTRETPSPEWRSKFSRAAVVEQWRRSLFEFVKASWDELEPGTEPDWNWHIELLCWHVQLMLEGWLVANGHAPANGNVRQREIRFRVMRAWEMHGLTFKEHEVLVQNAIFNLPPGTLKSRILMVCAPAWMWLHCPTWTYCAISGVDDNVTRDSNMCRELVESAWYRQNFSITWKIHHRKNSVSNWETTAGGKRKSRTLSSRFTGVRVDALLLDDPDDAHNVFSEPKRKDTQLKWQRAVRNRANHLNRVLRICIQQRVHVDDWTAAQIQKGLWKPTRRKGWMWVVWPLRYGRGPKEAPRQSVFGLVDPRRVANENLHEVRFPEEVIADELMDKGPDGFAAQYDQNPEDIDGGLVKRSDIRLCRLSDDPPETRPRPAGVGFKQGLDVDGNPLLEDPYVIHVDPETKKIDLDFLCLSVDCSNGSERETASATSIGVIGGKGALRFILDDRSRVMGPLEMYDEIENAVLDWEPDEVIIEAKAMGASRAAELRAALDKGLIGRRTGRLLTVTVIEFDPGSDSKEGRAIAMAKKFRSGVVHVRVNQRWLYADVSSSGKTVDPGYIGEICGFPKAPKDDRVDMTGQALEHYRDSMSPEERYRALAS